MKLKEIKEIPKINGMISPVKAWANQEFMAQLYKEDNGYFRLSINKVRKNSIGRWEDGITWDELMKIKAACGFSNRDALEVYPMDKDIVNVSNMRHLFIPPSPVEFAWRSNNG